MRNETVPLLETLRNRAAANPAHIVLSEGQDPRVVAGAVAATTAGLARVTLIGPRRDVAAQLTAAGSAPSDQIAIVDPQDSALTAEFAQTYLELRGDKVISKTIARAQALDPMIFAALMVRNGHADGTLGGAVATTSETIRAALHLIGKAAGSPLVSSFFVMAMPHDHPTRRHAMIFADCGLIIDPDAAELAAIAAASAVSCRQLLGVEPKVALLSFSTKGSAHHAAVTKVADAVKLLRRDHPDIIADGELQFDAAFMPDVGASKAPDSPVAGQANVMIFPNLDAGNIGYKIAQRIGGVQAIGPILQGLVKPANDLSRGCTAADVADMIAVTSLQAQTPPSEPA
jgi:phosphate acetyltransferase